MTDSHLLSTGLFAMDFARQATNGFLGGIEGDAFYRLFAPDGGNAAYIVGHLAFTDDMTLSMLAGEECVMTDDEKKLFGGGAVPSETPAEYPDRDRIVGVFNSRRTKLTEYFAGLSEHEIAAPVEGPIAEFGDTRAKLMVSLAWHEGMHAGQLTVIRRQLDLPRVFG